MANELDYTMLSSALAPLVEAQQAMAMRPQKSRVVTTSTPYALEDLLTLRTMIGPETARLDRALKNRENFGYSFANALSGIPQQQGPGSWVSALARGLGAGYTGRTNAEIDRAQQAYNAKMKDITTRMAIDKAMGDKQTQVIGYDEMPYGMGAGSKTAQGKGADSVGGVQQSNFGRSVGYDPVENLPDFGPVTRAALSEDQLGVMKYLPYAQSAAKGLTDKTATQLQSTWSDISDNILSGRVLDFVGKAGGVRVADTPAEQEFIFGPIRNYQNMSKRQLQAGLKQARNNFVAAGLSKARQAGIDVSENELKTWWNSAFSVPEGKQTEKMYNVQNPPAVKTKEPTSISVGEIRNGYRFKGGDPKKKENWEAI
jgi:hypothetical protein